MPCIDLQGILRLVKRRKHIRSGAAILGHGNVVSTGFIGWMIVLSILVLSIIRTVMFVVMDSKGV